MGFRTATRHWATHNQNKYPGTGNFRESARRINGGYRGEASREAYYRRALNTLS